MTKRKPVILFRSDFSDGVQADEAAAEKHFHVYDSRVDLKNKLVIGRYSVLPYYKELERDLLKQNSKIINSFSQHTYVADFQWYEDVKEYTPKTWFSLQEATGNVGPFVLKGRTNSRKFEWDTHMYAEDWADVHRVERNLSQDGLVGDQGIIIRKFVPLKVLETGLNGLPFANEWRFFYLGDRLLSHGFYWTASEKRGGMCELGLILANKVAKIISKRVNFFVLDIAETAEGDWILIEVNDAQMSGLSRNNPDYLYGNLSKAVKEVENGQPNFC